MSNWGRSRNGQVLTPARRRLIRAYYARRPEAQAPPFEDNISTPLFNAPLGWFWTAKERAAYRHWRSEFLKVPRETKHGAQVEDD